MSECKFDHREMTVRVIERKRELRPVSSIDLVIKNYPQMRISVWRYKMITTVHEDDLAAWYRISAPVGDISIHDFEVEDDDPFFDRLLSILEESKVSDAQVLWKTGTTSLSDPLAR